MGRRPAIDGGILGCDAGRRGVERQAAGVVLDPRLTFLGILQPVNTADLTFLLLRAATAVLCGVAAREAWERARLPGQPRQRRWRARFGGAVLLALGLFALEDGVCEALGRPGEPLRWRSWVWVILDLSIPAQVLAVLATLRQRDRLEAELAAAVRRDPLTGLPNRTGFAEAATVALAAAARDGRPVAGAMLDIDFFKAINDGWGHGAGDVVLRDVAAAMRAVLRPGDVLARVGGEEFALLLPGVDVKGAVPLLERLRAAAATVPHPGAPSQRVTLSGAWPRCRARAWRRWRAACAAPTAPFTPPRPPGATR